VTTRYTVFGDKVSFETTGSDKIHYSYDASGNLFSMNRNGTEYYYVRNAQGDITGLIDNAGNLVVSYTYDTWGKLVSTTGSLAGTLGVKNPYRYRGYRYDTETGLYYLQSRYYNPEWGRFVNADGITGIEGELLTHNMFAYTLNNPVNMEDPTGFKPAEGATTYNLNERIYPAKPKSVNRIIKSINNIGGIVVNSLAYVGIDKSTAMLVSKYVQTGLRYIESGNLTMGTYVEKNPVGNLLKTATGKIGISSFIGMAISAHKNIKEYGWTSGAAGRIAIDGLLIAGTVTALVTFPGMGLFGVVGMTVGAEIISGAVKRYFYGE